MFKFWKKHQPNIVLATLLVIITGLYFSRAAISIGTGFLAVIAILSFSKESISAFLKISSLSFIFIYILFILSYFNSSDKDEYWHFLFFQLPLLIFPLFFATQNIEKKRIEILLLFFVGLTVLISAGTIIDFFMAYQLNTEKIVQSKAIASITGIPHYQFSLLIIIAIICCFTLIKVAKYKFVSILSIFFLTLTIHLLAYRTAIFCLYGLAVFWFIRSLIYHQNRKNLALKGLFVFVFIVLACIFITPLQLKIQSTINDLSRIYNQENFNFYSIAQRYAATLNIIEIIKRNIWIGVSPADFSSEMKLQYETNAYLLIPENRILIHNQYLYYLGSFGLFAFIIWLSLWILNIISSFKRNQIGSYILLTASISFLVDNFFQLQIGFTSILLFYYLCSQSKISALH